MLRKLSTAILAVGMMALTGCTSLDQFRQNVATAEAAVSAVVSKTVTPQTVIIASNAFDAVQLISEKYLRLPRCSAASGSVCRSPAATRPLIAAVKSGRKARDAAQEYVKANPNGSVPGNLYSTLTGTVRTIQSIFDTYQVEAKVQ